MQPDFLLVAAPRSGTTSLYAYLEQHPQIQMSTRKEPAYFHFAAEVTPPDFDSLAGKYGPSLRDESIRNYRRARALAVIDGTEYADLWASDPAIRARGEATPTYLFDANALTVIKHRVPQVKLVLLLRDPVARAYSEFIQHLRKQNEHSSSFADAIKQEPVEIDDFWWGQRRYVRTGLYSRHVERSMAMFGKANVGVFLYEDMVDAPNALLNAVSTFLEVEVPFEFDVSIRRKSGFLPEPTWSVRLANSEGTLRRLARHVLPDSTRSRLWGQVMNRSTIPPPPLEKEVRRRLSRLFMKDIQRLEELLDRDLSVWAYD